MEIFNFIPVNLKIRIVTGWKTSKIGVFQRQLWWGHRIPAFYYGKGTNDFVVAKTIEEAIDAASDKLGKSISKEDLRQDEDVLDTWFSSWLWPISVFDGLTKPNNEEIKYYYPTNDLVTAPEIMFLGGKNDNGWI